MDCSSISPSCSSRLLNPLHSLQQMRNELGRILRRWEMAQARHALHHRSGDLISGGFAHGWSGAPVVLASQKVDGAFLDVDAGHTVPRVEAAEVEVQVAVEDAVGLTAVEMPDELLVDGGGAGGHHAVDPVRVEEGLVHHGALVVELTIHG